MKDWRKDVRQELQRLFDLPDTQVIIALGHQPTFHHCGILAKYYLADKIARDNNAIVCNFVVDSDNTEPHLALPGKGESGFVIHTLPLSVDRGDMPCEYQVSPSSWELKRLRQIFNSEVIVPSCHDAALELIGQIEKRAPKFKTMSALVSDINLEYAHRLELNRYDMPVSRLSDTAGFMSYVFYLLRDCERLWRSYNDAIADFMQANGVDKSPVGPLSKDKGYYEMPFWLNMHGAKRQPLYFNPSEGMIACGEKEKTLGIKLPHSVQEFKDQLSETPLRIRPRAITFTAFCRLFFADYFIHGIGGAYYDQITDKFITGYFGFEPPAFACASATVWADLGFDADLAMTELKVNKAQQKLRDFHKNPQRYVSFRDNTVEVDALLRQKMILIEKSNAFRDCDGPHHERQVVFDEIRHINQVICNAMPDICSQIEQELAQARKELASQQVAVYRELFFGLFPPERLKSVFAQFIS